MTNSYQILIVDDEKSWWRKFRNYLALDNQFEVTIATSYEEAMDTLVAKGFSFDLVILDVNLTDVAGNVDGLRVGNEIWKHNKRVKVIIVTGSEDARIRISSVNFIPSHVILKQEFDKDSFLEKVHAVLLQKSPWEI